jgi:predicted ester cyclase
MSEEENKSLVLRYFDERWNKRNFAIVDELAPEDAEDHKAWLGQVHAAIGNLQFSVDRVVADDDHVVLLWTVTGVHQGTYEGLAPTGRNITFRGLAMLRVEDGQIVDDVAFSEGFGTVILGQTS